MDKTFNDTYQRLPYETNSNKYRAAFLWLGRNKQYNALKNGKNKLYHVDDIAAFEAQYKKSTPVDLTEWKQAIKTHAPNKRAIMSSLGYEAGFSNLDRYYFVKYPELKDCYEQASKEKADKQLKLFNQSLNCETFKDALKLTGVKRWQYNIMFRENCDYEGSATLFFTLRYRLKVVAKHKTLQNAAKELGITPSTLTRYLQRNLSIKEFNDLKASLKAK